ncbi:DegT/DnrJ/EryC1/StrS family aminotransferase [Aquiflexum sp. TKW24L]|uniref:DegT/DnrJ/EryC1/StrS family aminotransferase n=1 Tax=Aquiflexum sp. TKW24L TaxID=2942212 RepID=UPI0020BE347B|nr:DegT/DnrJ/EryC1/StrS family aminotransferase [Aquiflexum sp. TKW24L]MCL6260009.1 DegT/DnrJ/EryC1/StrS family aminotransferase [Aquiflexum sp. TKW24L]
MINTTIQMVDLKAQYFQIKDEVNTAIQNVLNETSFINGGEVKEFAEGLKSFTGAKFVIPCANGTDALQIAMMALDFKLGDEVIVPTFTYVATVEVIALLGLVPVFIDIIPETFELDYSQLSSKLTDKTVGIVTVHLYGQCANMEFLLQFAEKHNLKVIEDAAQAIGAVSTFSNGKHAQAGTMGHIGTTSFFPSKNLGCFGDGGAIFTNDEGLAIKMQMIANHGQKKKYQHDVIGVNSRLDTLQAAILRVKLKYLGNYIEARNKVAELYDEGLRNVYDICIPVRSNNSSHVFNQYTLRVNPNDRDHLKLFLEKHGIPTMIYYPIPLHLQVAYRPFGFSPGDFPVSESLSKEVISLPIHTELDVEIQHFIISTIKKFYESK